jgi:peroxiredoxin Q/BCP
MVSGISSFDMLYARWICLLQKIDVRLSLFEEPFITSVLSKLFTTMSMAQTKLKIGDKAPEFSGKDQDGKPVSLSSLAGKKVVLYFYPKDQTAGCTAQACNLRDNIDLLTQQGYVILGVSTDDEASHREFREKYKLPFTLIADTDKSITQLYGVWVEKERDGKKFMGTARTTFIIDANRTITDIIDKVETADHASQILKQ